MCVCMHIYVFFSFCRVSSVLNKNAKEYGKQYMTDNCDDTCWNSAQVRKILIRFKNLAGIL